MPRMSSHSQHTRDNERRIDAGQELNAVDVFVGGRVKLRRVSAGMSEEELGAVLRVTTEIVRAYESGKKRIGPDLLYKASIALRCVPTVFFEDI
jgi:ribosome-binding protein aMBF1 (putative translation factor)